MTEYTLLVITTRDPITISDSCNVHLSRNSQSVRIQTFRIVEC